MSRQTARWIFPALVALFATFPLDVQAVELTLDLAIRDPETDERTVTPTTLDSTKIGVVIVDMWNFHANMTAAERVTAMAPRMNRALHCARKLQMPILWCPTDVAGQYVGTPQRERAMAQPTPTTRAHKPAGRQLGRCKFRLPGSGGFCGVGNSGALGANAGYGWDGMCPDLVIEDSDYLAQGEGEVTTILANHGVTHIIYMGVHTNMCVFRKVEGIIKMHYYGFECMLARDLNDSGGNYDPAQGIHPDMCTKAGNAITERHGVATINMIDEMRKAGQWDDEWVVDKVSITPWGRRTRACQFEDTVTVTLNNPWLVDAEIRYTLDGSDPDPQSTLYEKPLTLRDTTTLRTAAFRDGQRVSLFSDGYFSRLGPMPPKPDVYLDTLRPMGRPLPEKYADWWWIPRVNESFKGKPLRMRDVVYEKGVGMRAPGNLRYQLAPEYDRFVARVGVDDNLMIEPAPSYPEKTTNGRLVAMHGSTRFHIYIDGRLAAESPVMRVGHEPWRFDVKIQTGARIINLSTTDAGSRSAYDLGNWVDAGFVVRESQ